MGMQAASQRPSQKLFMQSCLNLPWFQNSYLHWNDNSHPVGLLCPYWVKMAKIRLFPICFHCQIVRHRRKSRIRFIFFHPDLRHFTYRRIFGSDASTRRIGATDRSLVFLCADVLIIAAFFPYCVVWLNLFPQNTLCKRGN